MICKQCGNEMSDNEVFCGVCGAAAEQVTVLADEAVPSEQQNPYVQPVPPVNGQPAQPMYSQPVQPDFGQPVQPVYGQPVRMQNSQPAQMQFQQPLYDQPVQQPYREPAPAVSTEVTALLKKILAFGIAAAACAEFPFASILGIVFGIIAVKRAGEFDRLGCIAPKSRRVVGKILGVYGIVAGSIFTVYYFVYFAVIIFAVLRGTL